MQDPYPLLEMLGKHLRPSPLVYANALSERLKRNVWLKLECLNPTGSFKIRPAFYGILRSLSEAKKRGVLTSSSGNFAQAVAFAAKRLDVEAEIVMMESTAPIKITRTRAFGAKVTVCGPTFKQRVETFRQRLQETNAVPLYPYDSEETIAANSTIGFELHEVLRSEMSVLCPVSGGGLIAGIASALSAISSSSEVIAVQPQANPSLHISLQKGERIEVEITPSRADALVAPIPGEKTFPLIQKYVRRSVLVSEQAILEAMDFLLFQEKTLAEPGGAVSVAALMALDPTTLSDNIVCIISGANTAPEILRTLPSMRQQ